MASRERLVELWMALHTAKIREGMAWKHWNTCFTELRKCLTEYERELDEFNEEDKAV